MEQRVKIKKVQNRIRIILIVVFLGYVLSIFYKFYLSYSNHIGLSKTAPEDYAALFRQKKDGLEHDCTHLNKKRNPISGFDFEGKYDIIVYKLNLTRELPLKRIIQEERNDAKGASGTVYTNVNQNIFDLYYKSGKPDLASEIYLAFRGDSLKTVAKNDSVACYYMEGYRFSMRYGRDEPADIYAETKKEPFVHQKLPMSVLLLRRGKTVYFVLMSVNDKKTAMAEDFLYRTVIPNR